MTKLLPRCLFTVATILLSLFSAHAETFPSRPVRLIVAYPAGGAADLIARGVAQKLSEMWGEPVVVENREGGATQVAANAVALARGDGYTLLVTGMETFAISPFLYTKLSYDPVHDFVPVSSFGYSNQILTAPAASPFKNVSDVVEEARKEKGDLQYGTIGMGGSSHINMVLLATLAGVQLTPIHYHGGAPLLTALLGGYVPMGFLSTALVEQNIKSGSLRGLGVSSKNRIPEFPNLPAIAESVPGYESESWFGLFAPKGAPPEIVQKINMGVQTVFADPDFSQKFLKPNSIDFRPGTSKEFAEYVNAESNKWGAVIKKANLRVNN
jgi:tripartite-type tricarboxylate transporter receptor subunit TctC